MAKENAEKEHNNINFISIPILLSSVYQYLWLDDIFVWVQTRTSAHWPTLTQGVSRCVTTGRGPTAVCVRTASDWPQTAAPVTVSLFNVYGYYSVSG